MYKSCFVLFLLSFLFSVVPMQWDVLEKKIRDGQISKIEAKTLLKEMLPKLHEYFKSNKGIETPRSDWVFPVEGYDINSIYEQEKDYIPKGYNFFDGNRHGGHPAYDIFIRDKNYDTLDDRTAKSVNVLSVSSGVVVGKNIGWTYPNKIRGGNYVWIFDYVSQGLFYYAHLKDISVSTGDIVKAGDTIGTIGRTGKNAYPKRSPTHLHIMYLKYPDDGSLISDNIYEDLCGYSKINNTEIQMLILKGAKEQIKGKAKYINRYMKIPYPNGDVPDNEGVCTDVIIRAYRYAGIDLQKLLHEDRVSHPELYPIHMWWDKKADSNIDHRRCPNLFVFFKKHAKKLTVKVDKDNLKYWKPGDIVLYHDGVKPWHVAIVSDKVDKETGVPFIIDNFSEPGYTSETHLLTDFLKIYTHFRYP